MMYRRKIDVRGGTNDTLTLPRSSGHAFDMAKASSPKVNLAVIVFSLAVTVFFWRIAGIMLPDFFPADDLRLLQQTPTPLDEEIVIHQHDKQQVEAEATEAKLRPLQLRYDTEENTVNLIKELPPILEAPEANVGTSSSNMLNIDNETDNDDDGYGDECHVVNRQHKLVFPTCTRAHEIDGTKMSFINCGGSRCAFHFGDFDVQNPERQVVLKLQKFKKEVKPSRLEAARQDGLIMEQATASPYIANVFGVCGVAQIVEYSDKGTLHDLVKTARLQKRDTMKPIDKLKIAIHIASAVADLHDPRLAAAVHGDLCMNQYLLVDGIYKLNDFHMSNFVREDTNNKTCFDSTSYAQDCASIHAPEEKDRDNVDLPKADVYMMGNVMYYVYTKNFLYEGIPDKDALNLLYSGKRTPFPEGLDTTIPANAALQSAIQKCWTHYPDQRPSAGDIRDYLLKKFSTIVGRAVSTGDAILKVDLPPLPKDHRYTGSSFDTVNDNVKKHDPLRVQYNNVT